MIYRFEVLLRRSRRWFSRSEWMTRILRLPVSQETTASPGLIMIQIDGLSHTQLNRALGTGKMPFLKYLLDTEHYQLHSLYSGIPSSTPAFQGELLYGIKTAVPAFSYMERSSGNIIRMYDPAAAAQIEHQLESQGKPLLTGGSTYSNIFTGGAAESHYCPSSIGWGKVLRAANPIALFFFIIINAYSFLRTFVLLLLELFIAIIDCIRGLIDGRDFVKELKFVPTRVAICILGRELVTIGAKMDVARGLPIIHINLLGYDEQAHRRGPSSNFAHWTLKGIDDAIARIWRATKRTVRRDYELWVFSDHGQEETLPYPKQFGRTIEEAVAEVFQHDIEAHPEVRRGVQSQRVRFLGGKRFQKLFPVYRDIEKETQATIVQMGPVGMVYSPYKLNPDERDRLARALVESARIPLVLFNDSPGKIKAWCSEGVFVLPEQNKEILGAAHPFLEDVTNDLVALCQHRDAGDFVICGWRAGEPAYSFSIENGSHAGAGAEETRAFALLPDDTPIQNRTRDFMRPIDLRETAIKLLGQTDPRTEAGSKRTASAKQSLRIMTYNVHSCLGMDGQVAPDRIARLIAQYAPDVVALQELDVVRIRTGGVDQVHQIAQQLEMEYLFHPRVQVEEEKFGDAILTHLPMRLVKVDKLPGLAHKPHLEPRGALWVAIDVGGTEIQFINTHLGLRPRERLAQAEALMSAEWLAHPDCHGPVILCGDFNAMPASPVHRLIQSRLNDAQLVLDKHRPKKTLFGRFPTARIDHVFLDASIDVMDIVVPNTALARVASDHLPLIVDVNPTIS